MEHTLVKAKYRYDYKTQMGNPERMEPGDTFMLIKKVNTDWWYVRKDLSNKPVYLPATYLQEQEPAAVTTPTTTPTSQNAGVERRDQGSRHGSHNNMLDEINKRIQNRLTIASVEDLNKQRQRPNNLDVHVPAPQNNSRDRLPSPYSDTSSPLYPPSRESSLNSRGDGVGNYPPSVTSNNWVQRMPPTDDPHQGGYDVPQTGVPRGQTKSLLGQGGSTPHSPTTNVPPDRNVPSGWRVEKTITGDPVFINEVTSEKWYQATNNKGETYYYSEDRSKTVWELPVVNSPRRRMQSEGGGSDEFRNSTHHSRRPMSFHPNFPGSSSPSLPREGKFIDKSEIKRRSKRIANRDIPSLYDPPNHTVLEKEGPLILNHIRSGSDRSRGKKGRPGHAVLSGSQLKYYKDQKHCERDQINPEVSINLWKAEVTWLKNQKRKLFEVQCDQGTFQLQGEDESASASWYDAIRGAVTGGGSHTWGSGINPSPDDPDPHPPQPSPSPLTPSHPDSQSTKSISSKLMSFMRSRPKKEELKRKGILQEENVFGKKITKLCEEQKTTVPRFVLQCINHIDKHGIRCDGVYRVNGNISVIQRLRYLIDQEKPVDLDTSPWKEDVHVVTGALKLYFRELPEPLFTFATFDRWIAIMTKIPDHEQKINACLALIREMPRVNQDTINKLFSHLRRVMDNVQHNRMPAKNLATVFGPTLMWPSTEGMNMTMATFYQNQVMEFLLTEFDRIFPGPR